MRRADAVLALAMHFRFFIKYTFTYGAGLEKVRLKQKSIERVSGMASVRLLAGCGGKNLANYKLTR